MITLDEARSGVERAHTFFDLACSLDAFENTFFLTDHLRHAGYVSVRPESQVGKIIYDIAMEWYGFFHGLLVPNPQSLLMMRESQAIPDALKERIATHMDLLARYHRMGQYGNMTHTPAFFKQAVHGIVDLRFGSLADLFADIQGALDSAWANPAQRDEPDLRSYG